MSLDSPAPTPPESDLAVRVRHDGICLRFEDEWKAGSRPQIDDFLNGEPAGTRGQLAEELLRVELQVRRSRGENPTLEEYRARFPEFAAVIAELFDQTLAHPQPQSGSPQSAEELDTGHTVAGRYLILQRLGRGGMGVVYEALDQTLRRKVALKFVLTGPTVGQDWVELLRREVATALQVTNKYVCRVHDYDEAEGHYFLVMEFAPGGSLHEYRTRQVAGRVDPVKVNTIAWQLCEGLAAVHEKGIFHRDLKPGNVLLDKDEDVKLADFGLATVAGRQRSEESGQGTWQYMAPEQLDGFIEPSKQLDGIQPTRQSDLFALGLILYELVTGARPFPGATPQDVRKRQNEPPEKPSGLVEIKDKALERAILWCLERDPAKRPASAQEVQETLPPLSPGGVVGVGSNCELSKKYAGALLGVALAGLLLHAALADFTMAYRQIPPAKDPGWLRGQAMALTQSLRKKDSGKAEERTQSPDEKNSRKAEHSGFEWDLDLVKDASFHRPAAWRPEPDARSPLVYFWYRSGPEHHSPSNRFAPTDPPLVTPGMECILLDLDGHLIEYHAVPSRRPNMPSTRSRDELRDEWEAKLFAASDLKPGNFHRSAPHYRPPVYADDLWGLEEVGGTGKWVEVALCEGQLVYFRVSEPFSASKGRPDRAQGENVEAQGQRRLTGGFVTVAIVLLAATAAGPLAYRNWRRGRADVPGALRVVGIYALLNTLAWLFITEHVRSLHVERVMLANSFGVTAFWGAVLLVCYLAIEPYMRRQWPERLSSWNRVLSGNKFSDPLVGQHVLIGLIAGVCMALPAKLAAPAFGTYYLLAPVYEPLTPNVPPGLLFALVTFALIRTTGAFVVLLLLGWLFRKEWIALVLLVILLTAGSVQSLATFSDKSPLTWGVMIVVSGMVAVTMRKYGWTPVLVALFVSSVLNIMPLTLTPQAWYTTSTLTTAAVLVALALYGFFVSLGKQRLFAADS